MKKTSYTKGVFAEYAVCLWLVIKGYKILKLRYKTKLGEIDIVAEKKRCLHFIEVKYRQSEAKAKEAITRKNQKRVMNSAKLFIQANNEYINFDLSFDAITVNLPLTIKMTQNAWSE